jgi:hypothetical protein
MSKQRPNLAEVVVAAGSTRKAPPPEAAAASREAAGAGRSRAKSRAEGVLTAILKAERLPFDVITGTSESREKGRDMPSARARTGWP